LGGSPRHLDIIGVNYYGYNQWEHQRPHCVVGPDDPRHLPLSDLLETLFNRYHRPLIITETSSHGEFRASWLRDMGEQCVRALGCSVDLHGLCLYPIVDMFDWHSTGEPKGMGLWELCPDESDGECLARIAHEPTLVELRRLQSRVRRFHPPLRAQLRTSRAAR